MITICQSLYTTNVTIVSRKNSVYVYNVYRVCIIRDILHNRSDDLIFANFAKSAKKHKITNFAKFVILTYPLSVMGYQKSKSLLLFKYEIKQNVSNTNVVRNNIRISFTMVSMLGATIWFLLISRNLQKSTKSQISRNL